MFNEKLNKEMTAIYSEDTYTTDMKGSNNVCQSSKHFLVDACGRWFGRVILLGAIMFTFAFSSNVVYALAGIKANCNGCKWYCLRNHICAESGGGDRVYGHSSGPIEINTNLDLDAVLELSRTNIYIANPTDEDDEDAGNSGTIFVNVPVGTDGISNEMVLFHKVDSVIIYPASYEEWSSIKTKSYSEFIEYIINSYRGIKVLVYPNPVIEGSAFVKLDEEFLSNNNVQAVEYKLFGANQAFITTIPTSADITGETVIPAEHISTHGVYFIKCTITILRDGEEITEVVDVPFLVRP